MKILVISNTTWDNSGSFGNTFSNLFGGMQNVEIYNIACRHGKLNSSIVKRAVQLTDKTVLKSIYKLKFDPCFEMNKDEINESLNIEVSLNARKKRRVFSFVIRDVIWKLGRWEKSKKLNSFIEEIKPDVIYLPIYASPHICDFQTSIINKLNVPVVGHISDDVYWESQNLSIFQKSYRKKIRKKIRKVISKCAYLEVFAKNMQEEYSKIFGKDCFIVGKGIKKDCIDKVVVEKPINERMHFVYTGNLGGGRFGPLIEIGKSLESIDAVLDVYSATPLTDEMKATINSVKSINFKGVVSSDEVLKIQAQADYLVHVEGFTNEAIYSSKMSFSTKIIDYMLASKPIFAYGPYCVNSISVLKDNEIGVVSTSTEELKENMYLLRNNNVDYDTLSANVKKYLYSERDIDIIQKSIYDRLKNLVYKNESSTN